MAATIIGFQAGYRDRCCCFRCLVMFFFMLFLLLLLLLLSFLFLKIMISFGIIIVSTGVITPTVALKGVINI